MDYKKLEENALSISVSLAMVEKNDPSVKSIIGFSFTISRKLSCDFSSSFYILPSIF
jgi:hypothetical protein